MNPYESGAVIDMNLHLKEATPHKKLIDELLDGRVAKTELEHAAAREIIKLRELAKAVIDKIDDGAFAFDDMDCIHKLRAAT